MKSILMSSQGLVGTEKRSVEALIKVTFSHVINVASCNHLMNIHTHLGPIKMLLEYLKGLVDVKVTG